MQKYPFEKTGGRRIIPEFRCHISILSCKPVQIKDGLCICCPEINIIPPGKNLILYAKREYSQKTQHNIYCRIFQKFHQYFSVSHSFFPQEKDCTCKYRRRNIIHQPESAPKGQQIQQQNQSADSHWKRITEIFPRTVCN